LEGGRVFNSFYKPEIVNSLEKVEEVSVTTRFVNMVSKEFESRIIRQQRLRKTKTNEQRKSTSDP